MNKRPRIQNLFDNSNPNLLKRKDLPGDFDILAQKDERQRTLQYSVNERKKVFDFIRANPGLTKHQIKKAIDSSAGIKEWLRDGVIEDRDGRLYIAGNNET